MMACFMIVLVAFAGCAVDGTRLYMVNVRLQQACDAGALAGRKAMTDTSMSNTTLDATATAQANAFFANNFRLGWFGTTSVTFTPSKTAQAQVAGTAKATMPMTLMRIFGFGNLSLTTTCEASFDVADTDVIFVLDTTGSMACLPADDETTCTNYVGSAGTTTYSRPADGTGSGNDSAAGYPGSTGYSVPEKSGSRISAVRSAVLSFFDTLSGAVDPSTHIRYGFVTYTSTVNAGKAIMEMSPAYMVGGAGNSNTNWTYDARTASGFPGNWTYAASSFNVAGFVQNTSVADPTKTTGATSSWAGCIEERATTPGVMTFDVNALPNDLNPDLIPTNAIATQWKPMWPEIFYARNNFVTTNAATSFGDSGNDPNIGTAPYYQAGWITCGKPVSRLKVMTRTQVAAYVNAPDFVPIGGTYHDTGMIWGTRMLSPGGIFANDTAAWTGRDAPNRVIVFLTDGDMEPSQYVYGMYGNEYYDGRVAGGDLGNLKAYHNARFLAECAAAKARNVSIWTVSIASTATPQMQSCATTNAQALATTDGTGLSNAFIAIAKNVAMLRLSK